MAEKKRAKPRDVRTKGRLKHRDHRDHRDHRGETERIDFAADERGLTPMGKGGKNRKGIIHRLRRLHRLEERKKAGKWGEEKFIKMAQIEEKKRQRGRCDRVIM